MKCVSVVSRKEANFFLYIVFHVSNEVTHKISIIQAAWINDGPQRFRSFWAQLESRATFLGWRNETILIINLSCLSFSSPPLPLYPALQKSATRLWRPLCPTRLSPARPSSPTDTRPDMPSSTGEEVSLTEKPADCVSIQTPPQPKSTFREGSVGWLRKMWTVLSVKGLSCGCDSKGALLNPFASVQYLHVVQKT